MTNKRYSIVDELACLAMTINQNQPRYIEVSMSQATWDLVGRELYEEQEDLRDYLHSIDAEPADLVVTWGHNENN